MAIDFNSYKKKKRQITQEQIRRAEQLIEEMDEIDFEAAFRARLNCSAPPESDIDDRLAKSYNEQSFSRLMNTLSETDKLLEETQNSYKSKKEKP